MINKTRRQIPVDLRPRFIRLLQSLRQDMGDIDENIAWEVTARLLHAELMAEWEQFKDDLEIYGSEDVTEFGEPTFDDDPYSGEWGGAL